jgi:hypothetical protein
LDKGSYKTAPGLDRRKTVPGTTKWVGASATAGRVLRNVIEACEENILIVVRVLFTMEHRSLKPGFFLGKSRFKGAVIKELLMTVISAGHPSFLRRHFRRWISFYGARPRSFGRAVR